MVTVNAVILVTVQARSACHISYSKSNIFQTYSESNIDTTWTIRSLAVIQIIRLWTCKKIKETIKNNMFPLMVNQCKHLNRIIKGPKFQCYYTLYILFFLPVIFIYIWMIPLAMLHTNNNTIQHHLHHLFKQTTLYPLYYFSQS